MTNEAWNPDQPIEFYELESVDPVEIMKDFELQYIMESCIRGKDVKNAVEEATTVSEYLNDLGYFNE